MVVSHRRGGGRPPRGRNTKGQKSVVRERKADFIPSRTQDIREDETAIAEDDVDTDLTANEDDDESQSEQEEQDHAQSYSLLMRSLRRSDGETAPARKRRKLGTEAPENGVKLAGSVSQRKVSVIAQEAEDDPAGVTTEPAEEGEEATEDIDSDEEAFVLSDPFESHYSRMGEQDLATAIEQSQQKPTTEKHTLEGGTRKLRTCHKKSPAQQPHGAIRQQSSLKSRLIETGNACIRGLNRQELDLQHEMFEYNDIVLGCRTLQNSENLRDLSCLHALNHIFKTRDRVLKNNAKLAQNEDQQLDCRDQGFTRPKILILVPTKQACIRFVDSIIKLSKPDQQENKSRFLDTFSNPEDDSFQDKPADFRVIFEGNHEEDFRVGLKFTRKTIKFFSGFYNSDIILASPLGLMRTITTGGGKKDSKKIHDSDFLSSIEIAIMDHANALEMQNWQHVDYVFSQLNQLPKDSHGCDFNRVRHWYLDGNAKYLRQTIIFSEYLTPSISALTTTHLHNIANRIKYTPTYTGTMTNVPASLPLQLTLTFLRFDSPTPQTDSDSRFKHFTSTILPPLLRSSSKALNRGTLMFIPTYLDFVRLRNHFSTAAETTNISFGTISEYSPRAEVARARAHFQTGKHSILLYSERAHHYFRYKLKGVRRVLFYGVPENPIFWTEMIEAVAGTAQGDVEWAQSQRGKQGKGLVRALFSKWDVMKLERVVGTERVGRLVSDREGDVFDFI